MKFGGQSLGFSLAREARTLKAGLTEEVNWGPIFCFVFPDHLVSVIISWLTVDVLHWMNNTAVHHHDGTR